jgi:hypothetical protein
MVLSSVADLHDQRLAVGAEGSGTRAVIRRLLQRYSELRDIDPQHRPVESTEDHRSRMTRISELENETVDVAVPRDYSDDVYKLRRDIDLVRRKLESTAFEPA